MSRLRKGVDIREFGVGNMGAASVLCHVDVWEGIIVGLADMAKGMLWLLIAAGCGSASLRFNKARQ